MRTRLLCVAAATASAVCSAGATVLTFDPHPGNGVPVNQNYGDRVTSGLQNGFIYGTAHGPTPGVRVSYGPVPGDVRCWDDGYGDLHNVLYRGTAGQGVLEVRFEADRGLLVELHGFDLASSGPSGYYISRVDVLGPDGPLFTQMNVNVEGRGGGPQHTSFTFSRPLRSDVLTIRFNASNLGALSERIGIDNIAFGQVPAPGTAAALAFGLAFVGRGRR